MNQSAKTTRRCAVRRGQSDAERSAIDCLLTTRGWRIEKSFEAKDEDELNQQARDGNFDVIVFPDLDALLHAVWKGDADLAAWQAKNVTIELAQTPTENDWRALARRVSDSHARWRLASRRREILAGVILSALALTAAAVILWR